MSFSPQSSLIVILANRSRVDVKYSYCARRLSVFLLEYLGDARDLNNLTWVMSSQQHVVKGQRISIRSTAIEIWAMIWRLYHMSSKKLKSKYKIYQFCSFAAGRSAIKEDPVIIAVAEDVSNNNTIMIAIITILCLWCFQKFVWTPDPIKIT